MSGRSYRHNWSGWERGGACLLALCFMTLVFATPSLADFEFKAPIVADKVVRLWFNEQDGIEVWAILRKLNTKHCQQLWQAVDNHPYVLEVKEALHGPQQLQMYYGLRMTFEDFFRYR